MAIFNCPECKKEISDKAKNCPHCGYPLMELDNKLKSLEKDNKTVENVVDKLTPNEKMNFENYENYSNNVNNSEPPKSKKKKSKILVLVFVCVVLVIIMFVAYFGNLQTQTPNNYNNTYNYDDTAFRNCMQVSNSMIKLDLDEITTASHNYDFSSLELWCNNLKDDAERYRLEINSYIVTAKWISVKNEYKSALDDFYWAGYYGELAGKNMDTNYFSISGDYLNNASIHIQTCTYLIEQMS